MWTQTLALLIDAYRELNARKLFWVMLLISGVLVVIMSLLGISTEGFTLVGFVIYEMEQPGLTEADIGEFYRKVFTGVGIDMWLTWAAGILALISTAAIFPDFVSSGSIDLVLSKPIGRLRVFLTKYLTGLLFVTMQVAVFTVGMFIAVGIRADIWEPLILLAIPFVVLFFSYYFSVCVLVGVATRSTMFALLVTLLFWAALGGMNVAEWYLVTAVPGKPVIEEQVRQLESEKAMWEAMAARADAGDGTGPRYWPREGELANARMQLETVDKLASWTPTIRDIRSTVMAPLPKTMETLQLFDRALIGTELSGAPEGGGVAVDIKKNMYEMAYTQSAANILGSSLAFEAVVLCLAGWIFCRRDY